MATPLDLNRPPHSFPPAYIPSPPGSSRSRSALTADFNIPVPSTWRCGTCGTINTVQDLMAAQIGGPDSACLWSCCSKPSLQAVYDQLGCIYLYWRDDPALADLRDPEKLAEARRRVWEAGGEFLRAVGVETSDGDVGPVGPLAEETGEERKGLARRWTMLSQSSAASNRSDDSLDSEAMAVEE